MQVFLSRHRYTTLCEGGEKMKKIIILSIVLAVVLFSITPCFAQEQRVTFEFYSPTLKSLKVKLTRPLVVNVAGEKHEVYFLPDSIRVELPEGNHEYSVGRSSGQGTVYNVESGHVSVSSAPQRVSVGVEL